MIFELLSKDGNFYKVNMHCHTNISDGKLSPNEVKDMYKAAGYSAVCFTDHEVNIGHKELCDEDFIALHGYEVAIKQDESYSTGIFMPVYHFNMVAKSQDCLKMPSYYKTNPSMPGNARAWAEKYGQYDEVIDHVEYDNIEWINNYLKSVKDGGYLITYNHPQWSLQNLDDIKNIEHLHAIEIINGGCSILNDNTSIHYEQLLRRGKKLFANAGDDNHGSSDTFLAWTMIKSKELSYDALIEAYEKGDFYASEGPEIKEFYIENGKIIAKTSYAKSIKLFTEGRYIDYVFDTDYAEFEYLPEKFGSYFRLEVTDKEGKRAFSNAYFTKEIAELF